MSKCGVILCECNGSLERRISLQELSRFIHSTAPDINIVLGNNLCNGGELKSLINKSDVHPSVIGACSKIQSRANLLQDLSGDDVNNPCFTKIVDVLSEINSSYTDNEVSDRIKLLLASQISKESYCNDLLQDNIKIHFPISQTEITRRNLLASLIPQYEVIPAILHDDCPGISCQLCADICPTGAIISSNDTVIIDKSSCTGCGACVNACPRGAISYPGYSTIDLQREIGTLLSNQVELPYRVIAIACQSSVDSEAAAINNCPSSLFTMKVPSLFVVSPLLLLNAFNMGVDGIALIHNQGRCASKMSLESLSNTITFVQRLLDRWGIDKNRLKIIDKNSSEMSSELSQFCDNILTAGHTRFKAAPGSMTFEGMYNLAAIIKEMDTKLKIADEGVLSGEDVPFGVAIVDSTRCSGCTVCAQNCPTGAISAQTSPDSTMFKLIFQHARCIACGLCANVCPEKCINVNRTIDFSRLSDDEESIFVNEYVSCRNCNKPYVVKSMVNALKRKLEESGIVNAEWTEYCPSCRLAIQQKR